MCPMASAPVTTVQPSFGSRVGAGAAIVFGSVLAWVGVSLGLAVGLPWLADAGVTPTTLLGMAGLATGLAALIATGVLIVRHTSPWGRLWLLPWLVVLVIGTVSLSMALAATVIAPTPAPPGATALRGSREVTMPTEEGDQLHGTFLEGTNGAAVVLRHDSGSERSATQRQAAILADHGYAVLLTDARGHGTSQGRAMDLGWNGEADIRAALDFLSDEPGIDPDKLAVVGLSMGGAEAIGAAGADPRVRAVVAEGVIGRVVGDLAWLSDAHGWTGTVQEQWDRLTYGLVGLLATAPQPATLATSLAAARADVLLIAAGAVPDEGTVAHRLALAAPERVKVWEVAGAGHVQAIVTAPRKWETRVVGFLDRALDPQPEPD